MPRVSRVRRSVWSNNSALPMRAAFIQDQGEGHGGVRGVRILVMLQWSGETFRRTSLSMEMIYSGICCSEEPLM